MDVAEIESCDDYLYYLDISDDSIYNSESFKGIWRDSIRSVNFLQYFLGSDLEDCNSEYQRYIFIMKVSYG